ncbi:Uma2 family endonuclease [Paenibacillus mesophilus]|uniref:Uma2 family endonuclease n=1 Tax=Paenibacillus mesophilus TaxID=2582849 RepID=UPI0013052ADE|nr:Uma2 family endonuclease [Paenibacillus mesophilus]
MQATAKHDRVLKYNAYAKAGVKQYWIVDPYHEFIETFIGKDGSFERSGQYFKADVITDNPFDQFRLDLKELFEEMG